MKVKNQGPWLDWKMKSDTNFSEFLESANLEPCWVLFTTTGRKMCSRPLATLPKQGKHLRSAWSLLDISWYLATLKVSPKFGTENGSRSHGELWWIFRDITSFISQQTLTNSRDTLHRATLNVHGAWSATVSTTPEVADDIHYSRKNLNRSTVASLCAIEAKILIGSEF